MHLVSAAWPPDDLRQSSTAASLLSSGCLPSCFHAMAFVMPQRNDFVSQSSEGGVLVVVLVEDRNRRVPSRTETARHPSHYIRCPLLVLHGALCVSAFPPAPPSNPSFAAAAAGSLQSPGKAARLKRAAPAGCLSSRLACVQAGRLTSLPSPPGSSRPGTVDERELRLSVIKGRRMVNAPQPRPCFPGSLNKRRGESS